MIDHRSQDIYDVDGLQSVIDESYEFEDYFDEEEQTKHAIKSDKIEILPSEFTESMIKIPIAGSVEPFSFAGRRYMRQIYDTSAGRVLLKFSRQTEKSTLLGNVSIAYSTLIVAFKVLYVTATAQQATVFSVDRIKDPLEISPALAPMLTNRLSQNVFFKQLRNRSQIRIRYAFLSADRVRGISADKILIDEIQDILSPNIPVIEQCASHSHWKIFRYSGTPKSLDNTIEVYWDQFSTQNEWVVPCDRHTPRMWNILGEGNIGKTGLICAKCKKPIDANHPDASWASMQPITNNNRDKVTFDGYRVPQIMVPWITGSERAWNEQILFAYNRYDKAKFYNEVLGLSYDSGDRPLKRVHIQSSCDPKIKMSEWQKNATKTEGIYAGLDWGNAERASYTLLTLGGYIDNKFTIIYAHRFTGQEAEPQVQLETIAKLFVSIPNFRLAFCDYGMGFDRNDWLSRNFSPIRIKKVQYVGKQLRKVKWDPKLNRFIVHRTEVMSDVFNAIKRKMITFPRWEEFEDPFGLDMLNIFSEFSEALRQIKYEVTYGKSDDTFHSVLMCLLASMVEKPRPDILIPLKPGEANMFTE